jgi:hypothetical protein
MRRGMVVSSWWSRQGLAANAELVAFTVALMS